MQEPRAELFFESPIGAPYRGGTAFVNTFVEQAIAATGFATRTSVVQAGPSVPVPGAPAPALRVFSDKLLPHVVLPRDRGKNVVFFQGLKYGADAFLSGEGIDGYCANSAYLKAVLLSLLLHPESSDDLRPPPRRVLVGSVPVVVPCTRYPDGYPTDEPSHRATLRRLCGSAKNDPGKSSKGETWFGHAIRPGKANAPVTLAIAHHLSRFVRRAHGGSFKLFVYEGDYRRFRDAATALPAAVSADDLLIPVPFLSNVDLYWLMRRSKLCLCFDDYAEPFGLYPLDSVFNGCPVFTNGAGNLRHLLPANRGIRVLEAPSLYSGSAEQRFRVAAWVAAAIFRSAAGRRTKVELHRWRAAIRRRYDSARSAAAWGEFLRAVVGRAGVPALGRSSLRVGLSPFVRSVSTESGVVVADHGMLALDEKWRATLSAVTGLSFRESVRSRAPTREALYELFRLGVVAWHGPFGDPVRLGRAR